MHHPSGNRPAHLTLLALMLLLTPLLAAVRPQPANAAGVVSTCTEAALRAALAGGGLVTFSGCGTIPIASQLEISEDTIIDGGGLVTLDGGGSTRLFVVHAGAERLNQPEVGQAGERAGRRLPDQGSVDLRRVADLGPNPEADLGEERLDALPPRHRIVELGNEQQVHGGPVVVPYGRRDLGRGQRHGQGARRSRQGEGSPRRGERLG